MKPELRKKNSKNSRLAIAALAGLLVFAASCTKGKVSSTDGSSSSSGGATITLVYPTASGSAWTPIVSSGSTFVKGLNVTIEGTCTRGIATIKFDDGAGVLASGACQNDGSFLINYSYPGGFTEADKTFTVTGYDVTDAVVTGATATKSVRMDNQAPNGPTVTQIGSASTPPNPYAYSGSSNQVDISGSCPADTDHLIGPSGVTITASPLSTPCWTYTATTVDGASTNYNFYAYDLAGNQSAVTTQTIAAQLNPVSISGVVPSSNTTDSVSGFLLHATVSPFATGTVTDSVSGFSLKPGPNFAVKAIGGY